MWRGMKPRFDKRGISWEGVGYQACSVLWACGGRAQGVSHLGPVSLGGELGDGEGLRLTLPEGKAMKDEGGSSHGSECMPLAAD